MEEVKEEGVGEFKLQVKEKEEETGKDHKEKEEIKLDLEEGEEQQKKKWKESEELKTEEEERTEEEKVGAG